AQVEIELASGNHEAARAATAELEQIQAQMPVTAIAASVDHACGLLALASGDYDGAAPRFRKSIRLWLQIEAPYQAARAQLALGRALEGSGSREAAAREGLAAAAVFERLGALPDAHDARRWLSMLAD